MKNSSISIMMAAVIFAAAFAGIALVADDASAGTEETGDYTVTFSFDGGVIVKTMSASNTFDFKSADVASIEATVKAPTGYAFSAWKDASSGVIYNAGTAYTFTQDIVVEPVFKADRAIVQLTYVTADGETITVEFMNDKDAVSELKAGSTTEAKDTDVAFDTKNIDIAKFAKAIGATATSISDLELKGYVFKGFLSIDDIDKESPAYIKDLSTLKANAVVTVGGSSSNWNYTLKSADVVEYIAVFEPIYDVVFYINDTAVLSTTSNMVIVNGNVVKVPDAPTKDNYIFMGWYDILGERVIGYSVDKKSYDLADKDFEFTEDTALFAKFVPLTYTVTFVYGEDQEVFITETVKYGEKAIEPNGLPAGYKGWDFDFSEAIVEDTVIEAIVADPVTIYNVTFEIEGKTPVTQKSDSLVVPDTTIDGKVFKGWVVKGQTQYVDPAKYDITQDVTFVAIYDKAPAPAGPGFFQTTSGQLVMVIIAAVLVAFVYAVYKNMFGLKDTLASFKLQRVRKE